VHDDELLPTGALPHEPHDHRVTHVVTPRRTLEVGAHRHEPLPIDPELDLPEEDVAPGGGARANDLDVALVVAAGGALGSLARWGLNELVPHGVTGFPWATFLENVTGAFVIGALLVLLVDVWTPHRYARPFLAVGVLGGYTTFSTYMADVHGLVLNDRPLTASVYLVGSLAVGLLAATAGIGVTRRLAGVQP